METQRWKLTIEYDGSGFFGWQRQAEGFSVQQVLEESAFKLCGQEVRLHTAGRTDSGVHALGQVAHVDLPAKYDATAVRNALNVHSRPHAVSVVNAEPVSNEFHARFNAVRRYYRYVIFNRSAPPVIGRQYAWHIGRTLDIDKMRHGAKHLIGVHDYTSFRATACQAKSPVRSIDSLEITRDGDKIFFDINGRSFLHHQVRNIVGTLRKIGDGSWEPDVVLDILAAKKREACGPTAPPEGLFFMRVDYEDTGSK